jgi:small multidrug resistance pump
MQSWLVLTAAIICEVVATVMMELSQSLTRWRWVPPMLLFYVLALLGLALALKTIEVGIAYAVWAGAGTLLIAILGVIFFKESVSALKVVSMFLVIAGVVGLNLADLLAHR